MRPGTEMFLNADGRLTETKERRRAYSAPRDTLAGFKGAYF